MKPKSNGDPVTAAAQSVFQVDDTTLVTTISGADAYAANPQQTNFAITVVILAQVIDGDVLIAEGPGYRRVTSSKGLAPSPGPKPVGGGAGSGGGGGSGAGGSSSQIQTLVDQLMADGATQEDVDALVAEIPQGDATEGLVLDAPDDTTDTGEPVAPVLSRQEPA